MASVYLGRLRGQGGFERWVAVKRIHEHLSQSRKFKDMFLDEVRLVARLNHPNIVHVTDTGIEGERPFLVMEYLDGETLSMLQRTCRQLQKRLPLSIAARIVACTLEGLHHAHELANSSGVPLGLVHRDISPQNVMVTYDGHVKLTDFGIAKAVGRVTKTRTGLLKGKTAYLAPEQVLARPIDRRVDIFAMGIVLYEATLGRRLFKSESEFESLRRITVGDVRPPSQVSTSYPSELEAIVMRALRMKPEDRYQTASEMQAELEQYLHGLGQPVGTSEISAFAKKLFHDRIEARKGLFATLQSGDRAPLLPDVLLREESSEFSAQDDVTPHISSESEELQLALASQQTLDLVDPRSPPSSEAPAPVVSPHEGIDAPPVPRRRIEWTKLAVLIASASSGLGILAGVVIFLYWQDGVDEPVRLPATDALAHASLGDSSSGDAVDNVFDAGGVVFDGGSPASFDAGLASQHRSPQGRNNSRKRPVSRGFVTVITNPWCEVYLGSKRLGRTPFMRVPVPTGNHVLRFLPEGRGPARRVSVRVRPDQLTPMSLDFSASSRDTQD